jgi:hypothetical protein
VFQLVSQSELRIVFAALIDSVVDADDAVLLQLGVQFPDSVFIGLVCLDPAALVAHYIFVAQLGDCVDFLHCRVLSYVLFAIRVELYVHFDCLKRVNATVQLVPNLTHFAKGALPQLLYRLKCFLAPIGLQKGADLLRFIFYFDLSIDKLDYFDKAIR